MDNLTRENFAATLNTTFQIYFMPETPTEVELIEVTELYQRRGSESFALLFQGPSEPIFNQRLMRVVHPELGEAELFLVPVSMAEKGVQYEALFNRVLKD